MSLLNIIKDRTGFKRQSVNTWEGPCPRCGGTKRFIVWVHTNIFKCRECDFKGDTVKYLREVDGLGCAEAHLESDTECISTDCPALGKCAATKAGGQIARSERARKLNTPADKVPASDTWQPTTATTPAEKWQERAEKLVEKAHEALQSAPDQLQYLAARGLPAGAVVKNRLGWLPEDLYRDRESWGLEQILKESGKKKKLWIPQGIVIPAFRPDGSVFRIRIRLTNEKLAEMRKTAPDKEPPRYYWLPGSGDDTWILNPQSAVFVIVESDLDGLLIDWHAGDLVGTVPMGTCSARPKAYALTALSGAVCILNALDCEPRINEETGRHENPGGENWRRWWMPRFPQSKRHAAPIGKDPGEAHQSGVSIREWIISGLPLGIRPATTETQSAPIVPQKTEKAEKPEEKRSTPLPRAITAADGRKLFITDEIDEYARLVTAGKTVFDSRELELVQKSGFNRQESALFIDVKLVFPGARIIAADPDGKSRVFEVGTKYRGKYVRG